MADEKKGLFGRLFGKKKTAEDAPPAPVPAPVPDEDETPSVADGPASDVEKQTLQETPPSTAVRDGGADEADVDEGQPEPDVAAADPLPPSAEEQEENINPQPTPEPAPAIEPAAEPEPEVAPEPEKKRGFFSRLTAGLSRTSQKLTSGVADILTKKKLDEDTIEELEDLLISADLGMEATERVIGRLRKERVGQDVSDQDVREILAAVVAETLEPLEKSLEIDPARKPHIILTVGVNGAGKTTTIGKLASKYVAQGHSVLLAAGDTFRAAAIEQLKVWGERTGAPVLSKPHGADAAGLAFEAIETARRDGHDVVMIDTAGRLQNRSELMDELSKIVRVIKKLDPDAPHDTLLVLDATVGQNAIRQAEAFSETAGVTGLVMTKLDGTARGGILVALGDQFGIPIHHIGIGEGVDDLRDFNARDFARAMTTDE
ncbi:MAG: signal recognition particle-docking protein FtsY [Pseudomonadota bacterium]